VPDAKYNININISSNTKEVKVNERKLAAPSTLLTAHYEREGK